ncbi:glucose 1-dehydrogenase [Propionimicrobium sp. PCR01-08-3]|uniref:SDR family NAD(P)-dependent oxidoreductase n=1 Tax=Propionimicrobium sp. PCR01-08-3 TaxID=3052086 RepID=UPI00255CFDB4|nr:glucose 1-dehydrogenase [Propionimicrobium sp. PCR01-08-3]WIY81878.1 SDR family oxidoreductase [Propionimicrobium sp. PCR01-08-3]
MHKPTQADTFSLVGKTAVVSGGSSGIGQGIAQKLAEAGAAVIVAARHAEACQSTVDQIVQTGGTAEAHELDVTTRESVERLCQDVVAQHGGVDIVVNSAGIGLHSTALQLTDEDWDRVLDTNLNGTWRMCQIFGRVMVPAGHGSIINIGSMSGQIVNRPQWHLPYGVSKAAVHHLTRSLAAEWARDGVRVNCIAPGYVRTAIASTEYEDYAHYWRDEVPMGRYGSPSEIAPLALYLASDDSSFMTGTVLTIDGGYTLW